MSYSNQKILRIVKPKYEREFLQVGITEWQNAYKVLTPSAFAIYLYLASNADGFCLELSQKAIENSLGIKKTAYFEAVKQLESKGYIQPISGNMFYFLLSANSVKTENSGNTENSGKTELAGEQLVRKNEQSIPETRIENSGKTDESVRFYDREIDNINNKDKIKNKIEEKERIEERLEERGAATPPASAEISEIQKNQMIDFSEIQKNAEKTEKAENAEIEETKTQEEPRRLEETSISHWDKDNPNVIGEIDNEKDLIAYLEILFGDHLTSKVKSQLQVALKTMSAKEIARFYFYCDQKEHRKFLRGSEMTLGLLQFDDIKERANTYWTNLDNRKKQFAKDYNLWQLDQKVISVKLPPRKEKKLAFTKEKIEAMV